MGDTTETQRLFILSTKDYRGRVHTPSPTRHREPSCGAKSKHWSTVLYTAVEFKEAKRLRGSCANCLWTTGGVVYFATRTVTAYKWFYECATDVSGPETDDD